MVNSGNTADSNLSSVRAGITVYRCVFLTLLSVKINAPNVKVEQRLNDDGLVPQWLVPRIDPFAFSKSVVDYFYTSTQVRL